MARKIIRWDEKIKLFWKNYIIQTLLATLSIFILLVSLHLQNAVIIASIGATAFIVFTMPQDITAHPRNVIGGHFVGFACGALCALIPHSTFVATAAVFALAVGLSIFLMVVIDTEHPPASGTALGLAITGYSSSALISVVTSVIILSLIHRLLKSHLKNLV
jgi:CBS-domain-containing membrane protein